MRLKNKGQLEEAIVCYGQAIALDPKYAEAHCNLGHALRRQGRFAEALAALQRGHELGSEQPGWRYPSANWVRQVEPLAALEGKLLAFLKGEFQPKGNQDRFGLVGVCQAKKFYHTAARLYADAFAADPKLADDLKAAQRYNAACSAALAAAGEGRDPGKLTAEERTKLRVQALAWLQTDLQQWTKQFPARDSKALPGLLIALPAWQRDAALSSLRDPKERAKLSREEQQAWANFWASVEQFARNFRTESFPGALTAKEREQVHEVKLQAGQTYVIDLESKQFDTYLKMQDAKGKLLAENDDISPENQNSRLLFTAPADGTYRLVATSFGGMGTGAYDLIVRSFVDPKK